MNRRKFIQTGGLTLGACLLTGRLQGMYEAGVSSMSADMKYPDKVDIITENNIFENLRLSGSEFSAGDITIQPSIAPAGMKINLSSPSKPVRFITLKWNIPREIHTLTVGDHWERGYGDLQWAYVESTRIMPWYFMEYDGKVCNGFGVKTSPAAFCYWQTSADELKLTLDVRSGGKGVQLGDRQLTLATIVNYIGHENERPFLAMQHFCKKCYLGPFGYRKSLCMESMIGILLMEGIQIN